jgi:energy-coupling factor transport system ATP-binding protein
MGIRLDAVSHVYQSINQPPFEALKNVSLTIEATDEFIALVGETGSGKSTLVQHFNALMAPTSGEAQLFDVTLTAETFKDKKIKKTPIRKRIGLVFQFPEYQLFEETVLKDVAFAPKNFGLSEDDAIQKAKDALRLVGLDESFEARSPFHLSGGEKKRVSIAGILAMEPDILVLDEPTSGLDPKSQEMLMDVFTSIQNRTHTSIVFITHDMNWVERYAKRVLVIKEGALVYDGTPHALFQRPELMDWKMDVPDRLKVMQYLKKNHPFDDSVTTPDELINAIIREVQS